MNERERAKILALAGVSIVIEQRLPGVVYEFHLPQRTDNPKVARDMYRVQCADGSRSDLANLTRIKEAALAQANRILRKKKEED